MAYVGYATTIYCIISMAVAFFLLITKQVSFQGFGFLRIVRWFLTIPLIVLEELMSKKGK